MDYYNRYKMFTLDGKNAIVPSITIDYMSTDLFIVFNKFKMRLDNLSYKYYGDPNYGWLILLANPEHGSLEFDLQDGITLRIPYPLETAIERYEKKVKDIVF